MIVSYILEDSTIMGFMDVHNEMHTLTVINLCCSNQEFKVGIGRNQWGSSFKFYMEGVVLWTTVFFIFVLVAIYCLKESKDIS